MRASFRIAGDLDVDIESDKVNRLVTITLQNPMASASCLLKPGDQPRMAMTNEGYSGKMHLGHHIEQCEYLANIKPRFVLERLNMSRQEARAIASALMGAAADV